MGRQETLRRLGTMGTRAHSSGLPASAVVAWLGLLSAMAGFVVVFAGTDVWVAGSAGLTAAALGWWSRRSLEDDREAVIAWTAGLLGLVLFLGWALSELVWIQAVSL